MTLGEPFRIKVIDKQVSVGAFEPAKKVYGFYIIPDKQEMIEEIANKKRSYEVPKIERMILQYRVEYVRPTPLTTASGSITFIDCWGNEVMPPPIYIGVSDANPVCEGSLDISKYMCTCPLSPFGINAVKVSLGGAAGVGGIPIPTTVFNVKVWIEGWWA